MLCHMENDQIIRDFVSIGRDRVVSDPDADRPKILSMHWYNMILWIAC